MWAKWTSKWHDFQKMTGHGTCGPPCGLFGPNFTTNPWPIPICCQAWLRLLSSGEVGDSAVSASRATTEVFPIYQGLSGFPTRNDHIVRVSLNLWTAPRNENLWDNLKIPKQLPVVNHLSQSIPKVQCQPFHHVCSHLIRRSRVSFEFVHRKLEF